MAERISMIIFGTAMLVITLLIQFILYKKKKDVNFWSGSEMVLIVSVLGIVTGDVTYFAGILGYAIGDCIGKFAGWHKPQVQG